MSWRTLDQVLKKFFQACTITLYMEIDGARSILHPACQPVSISQTVHKGPEPYPLDGTDKTR